jgi:hypothetical protein
LVNARQVMCGIDDVSARIERRRRRKKVAAARLAAGGRRVRRPMRQLSLAEARTWGGPRKGSGRKPVDPAARRNVVHRTRPAHDDEAAVHVTMRGAARRDYRAFVTSACIVC